MSKLLSEIHQQPDHIRALCMWICVILFSSLVGFMWFRTTQHQVVALLHPDTFQTTPDGDVFAKAPSKSPFRLLADSLSSLRANISDLVDAVHSNSLIIQRDQQKESTSPRVLPLTKSKQ